MKIRTLVQALEAWAPPAAAESYDNTGLLTGNPESTATGVLINLDMTEEVVLEAVARGCNLVVAHHPIWFMPRKRLTPDDYVSRAIIAAIKHDIALYAIHTNLDNIRSGVNARMAAQLGLLDTTLLQPHPKTPEAGAWGAGMIGYLPVPLSPPDFLQYVKTRFQCGGIRYAAAPLQQIHLVAVCGGAGSFLTEAARRQGAHAFMTADITYHKFFDNENSLYLLDIGHHESEQFTSQLLHDFLSEKFPTFGVHLSAVYTNPVRYC
ncbi:MAG: Nif3-like dinuclear metal center hexameric protein [Bacteroidia bacterium]